MTRDICNLRKPLNIKSRTSGDVRDKRQSWQSYRLVDGDSLNCRLSATWIEQFGNWHAWHDQVTRDTVRPSLISSPFQHVPGTALPTCGPWLRHCAYAHAPGALNVPHHTQPGCGACAGGTKWPTCREGTAPIKHVICHNSGELLPRKLNGEVAYFILSF